MARGGQILPFALWTTRVPYQKAPVLLRVTGGGFKGMLEDRKGSLYPIPGRLSPYCSAD